MRRVCPAAKGILNPSGAVFGKPVHAVSPEVVVFPLLAVGDDRRSGRLEARDRVPDRIIVERVEAGIIAGAPRHRGDQFRWAGQAADGLCRYHPWAAGCLRARGSALYRKPPPIRHASLRSVRRCQCFCDLVWASCGTRSPSNSSSRLRSSGIAGFTRCWSNPAARERSRSSGKAIPSERDQRTSRPPGSVRICLATS